MLSLEFQYVREIPRLNAVVYNSSHRSSADAAKGTVTSGQADLPGQSLTIRSIAWISIPFYAPHPRLGEPYSSAANG
jgi:hypothetical protein